MPRQTRRKSTASVATPSREAGNSQSDPTGSPSVVTEGVVAKLVERIEGLSARVEALASLPPTPPNVTPSTPSQRQPLAQEDPLCRFPQTECRQLPSRPMLAELKTTDFPRFIGGSPEEIPATVALPATSGGSVRAHLSSFDRLLATSAIAPGSVCSYFLLLYSLSEDVRNRISASTDYALSEFSDVQALVARFQELYRDLRAALLTTYQDVSEAARLRQEWHDLRQTAGSSYLSFLSQVDKFRGRTPPSRLQVPHKATEIWCLVAPVPLAADLILGVILRAAVDRETAQGIVKGQPARDEEPVNNVDFLHILAETIEDDSILCGFDDGFLAEGVDKSEWAKVTGLISHFAVLSPSKSTPVLV
ncbi:hypothetical protein FOZ60_003658 [Perkinsus olseni]|uniref:Uncharacterized protein n=1 Tax=Perkinsus olseni TaxID=32597 RepID=A0A7J6PHP2_PEROL|nr:hypothetical protein FOZ60_003658 [Perkinsus olseni]